MYIFNADFLNNGLFYVYIKVDIYNFCITIKNLNKFLCICSYISHEIINISGFSILLKLLISLILFVVVGYQNTSLPPLRRSFLLLSINSLNILSVGDDFLIPYGGSVIMASNLSSLSGNLNKSEP